MQGVAKIYKNGGAENFLGCSDEFLKQWYEFHFTYDKKMNEHNAGIYWHQDHVIPCKLWNDRDYRECHNWRNLMPLEAKKNLSKCDNFDIVQFLEQNKRIQLMAKKTGKEYSPLLLPKYIADKLDNKIVNQIPEGLIDYTNTCE